MKRQWDTDELIEQWTLLPTEMPLLLGKQEHNQLGFAVLLKFFQNEGRFPHHRHDVPGAVVSYLAKQLDVASDVFFQYDWRGRTSSADRQTIRTLLGFREATVEDGETLITWLCEEVLGQDQHPDHLKLAFYERCRTLHIEPPSPKRVERLIRSATRTHEERFYADVMVQLSPSVRAELDTLLVTPGEAEADDGQEGARAPWTLLKADSGRASLQSILQEIGKLQRVRQVGLPTTLFQSHPPRVLQLYRQRAASESLHELRRHPDPVRYTLLSIFCWRRSQELTDTLVDLLIQIIHRIGARAEEKVEQEWLADRLRVEGKTQLLFRLAEVAVEHPDGIIREVLYPVVGEKTLHDLVKEWRASDPTFQRTVQRYIRASYSRHYRRMVPQLLEALVFRSNNEAYQPLIRALELLKQYAGRTERYFAPEEQVPLDGVVRRDWRAFVVQSSRQGTTKINRITYEICVLDTLREKLRCKEIWVEGAHRYRNPEEDLPADFETQRESYYQALQQPLDAETFITTLQATMNQALEEFDQGLPKNKEVKLLRKAGGWIKLSPLEPQPEPVTLTRLKAEIWQRWPLTSLLDILKETDLQVGFSDLFKSVASREVLERRTLQKRLLLCLYGLGTNTGLKRVSAGEREEGYTQLLAVRRRFIHKEHLQNAIAKVVNAIFAIRQPQVWGEGTTACASDAKKFAAWDQNLMTEWHIRYRGAGIMIYWHVERNAACVYSQLKQPSSSEVAAMITGLLRQQTDMTIEKNYVDSNGQSDVAFAFCHLLGFRLLPRLKAIHGQKLYRPYVGQPDAYPNLQLVLTRPIHWELIRQQYDQLIKYATALRLGTADPEAILRRFTRNNPQHPTYQALLELGKAIKTIFLCQYLHSSALRREIHEGLNVVESWNSVNHFIFYGRGREISSNRLADQEIAMLALHLLQICLVYINTLMIQKVLADPAWSARMTTEDWRALSPLLYAHINPYGTFRLNLDERLDLEGQSREGIA